MKFWQKIFLSTLVIFITLFDIAAFVLVSSSYNYNLQREEDNSIREQAVILSSLENSITNANEIFPDTSYSKERLISIIKPLANYYETQNVYLALYNGNTKIFSNTPNFDDNLLNIQAKENINIHTSKIEEERYLFVASKFSSYPHLTFVYARDISQLDSFLFSISRVFVIVSVVVCIILALSIFLLLKRLTSPLTKLTVITSEIASGAYHKRVNIDRKDELGELGHTFNIMADSVEDKVNQLTKASESKQQFIDNLTHEMKTPLTSILGYSEYLQKAMINEEQRIIATGHLNEAAKRLQSLSTKLLDLTYIRGKTINLQKVNIEGLFSSLETIMAPILKKRNINLETITNIKWLRGDEALLLSLLINLVENSARASADNEVIFVKAYYKEYPILEVIDNGYGLDKKEIEKITEPFYRVDQSRSRDFGGAGLGLSIVAQIADYHGAKLIIQSQQGTTVRIIFNNSITT
ncbi:HAMP domain-containing sensor histidine kinase [Bacillus sp. FJAT-50079]|uniref:sensor histidine kinase n=1 Tax=Bacillus sp. FJAT-50079 TaxID=2833577 RepID=UPI001BC9B876|nr:HAMP domain-containing sensor histidine kinase [Bacillus sp. FJAT-50079]MBS4210451.1 HAMP domain-containing histidine kinase [Bacillus sp. FJAT-50079]